MARFLFAPETFNLAETTRMIEVAAALPHGSEVLFIGYSTRYAHLITEAGFCLRTLQPRLDEHEADQLIRVDQGRALRHPFTPTMLRQRVMSELEAYRDFHPDVITIGTTLSVLISARAAGIPLVYVKPFAYSAPHLEQADALPVVSGRSSAARLTNRLAATLAAALARRITFVPRAFRIVAAEHGVSLPTRTIDMLDADLNLVTTLPEFIDEKRLPADYRVVGPVFAQLGGEVPDAVIQHLRRPGIRVYAALGSSANRRLALRLLHTLASLDVTVVAPLAHYLTDADLAALPGSVLVTELLPAHLLGPHIDVSVIHGGEGTVQTACASGAPFVGLGLQLEQRINLDACERSGNALRITPRDLTAQRLGALLREVQRPRYRDAALRMRDLVLATSGAQTAASHLSHLAHSARE